MFPLIPRPRCKIGLAWLLLKVEDEEVDMFVMITIFVAAAAAEALMAWGFLMSMHLSASPHPAKAPSFARQRPAYRHPGMASPPADAERLRLAYFALRPD